MKNFNFAVFFSLIFILFCEKSYSQINYRTDLLNYVWSANCNDVKAPAVLFTESSSNDVIKNVFVEGKTVDSFYQSIKKIEHSNEVWVNLTFIDNKNRSGLDTIELKGESYRLINRIIDGELFTKSGKSVKTNAETPYFYKCSSGSASFVMVDNSYSNKNSSNQTNTKKTSKSYKEACFGPDDNYKKIQYSDGTKANVIKDIMSGYNACGCEIQIGSKALELTPSMIGHSISPSMLPEVETLYKAYSPFYGCPTDADYLKIVQILKIQEVKQAEAEKKEDEKLKIAIHNLIEMNQRFCKGTPKTQVIFFEYLGSQFRTNPDEIKLKRVQPTEKYLGCTAFFYSPRGPITCQITFDKIGTISGIEDISLSTLRNIATTGSLLGVALAKQGCE